jgi:hypothetical protein
MPALRMRHKEGTVQKRTAHEEWLLDEAIKETFPASDPVSPFVRETTDASRAARRNSSSMGRAQLRGRSTFWWIMAGCVVFYVGYVARRRRR